MQQGELQPATFQGYYKTCEGILKFFDKQRLVSDLAPQDFGALRSHLASRLGVVGLANAITRIKVPFRWAFDNGVIDKPVRCGTARSSRPPRPARAGSTVPASTRGCSRPRRSASLSRPPPTST